MSAVVGSELYASIRSRAEVKLKPALYASILPRSEVKLKPALYASILPRLPIKLGLRLHGKRFTCEFSAKGGDYHDRRTDYPHA